MATLNKSVYVYVNDRLDCSLNVPMVSVHMLQTIVPIIISAVTSKI